MVIKLDSTVYPCSVQVGSTTRSVVQASMAFASAPAGSIPNTSSRAVTSAVNRFLIFLLLHILCDKGTNRRRLPVAGVSSSVSSCERKQAPQCGVATIEHADKPYCHIAYFTPNAIPASSRALRYRDAAASSATSGASAYSICSMPLCASIIRSSALRQPAMALRPSLSAAL